MSKIPRETSEARVPLSIPNSTGGTHPDLCTHAVTSSPACKIFSRPLHLKKHVHSPVMFYLQLYSLLPWPEAGCGQAQAQAIDRIEMLPLVNCPTGMAPSLGTYDSKLSLLRPLRAVLPTPRVFTSTLSH